MSIPLTSYETVCKLVLLRCNASVLRLRTLHELGQWIVRKLLLVRLFLTFNVLLRLLEDLEMSDASSIDDPLQRVVKISLFL